MNIKHVISAFGRLYWRSGSLLAAILFISLLLSAFASASTAQSYAIPWWTIDNGGATTFSTGGSLALGGTIGQPDAGVMGGGRFALAGGFWRSGVMAVQHRIYLPLVLRQSS